jgi:nitrate/TMAO reductase-like tetraheme cytochrome c subunit
MKNKTVVIILIAGILYSCSPSLYMPALSDTVQQQKLIEGRQHYVDHCSSCHNLHFPKEYTAAQWQEKIDEMAVKAKINGEQKHLILQYLTSQP